MLRVAQAQHAARELDERVLEAAAGAEEGHAGLARMPDAAQRSFHARVRAARNAPHRVEPAQRICRARQLRRVHPLVQDAHAERLRGVLQRAGDGEVRADLGTSIADQGDAWRGGHPREATAPSASARAGRPRAWRGPWRAPRRSPWAAPPARGALAPGAPRQPDPPRLPPLRARRTPPPPPRLAPPRRIGQRALRGSRAPAPRAAWSARARPGRDGRRARRADRATSPPAGAA